MAFVPAPIRRTGTAAANMLTTTAERTEQAVDALGCFIGAAHAYAADYEQGIKLDVAENSERRRNRRSVERAIDDASYYQSVHARLADDPELETLFYEALADHNAIYESIMGKAPQNSNASKMPTTTDGTQNPLKVAAE